MKSHSLGAACAVALALVVSMSAAAAPVSGQGTWETTLQPRDLDGNPATIEAYYDTSLNITWLANANLAASNTFGALGVTGGWGTMVWGGGLNWINGMNAANYLGYNDWRLPKVAASGTLNCTFAYSGTDCGYNVITAHSEMAHLFYNELGNQAFYDSSGTQLGVGLFNSGPFNNLQENIYWTGTQYSTDPYAWYFDFLLGGQNLIHMSDSSVYAWAVRDGDVAAVPVPAAAWLFGSGLLSLLGVARRF